LCRIGGRGPGGPLAGGAVPPRRVQLDSNNAGNSFTVLALVLSEALFNGTVGGNGTSFIVSSSSTNVVSAYLMCNAAVGL
jgi:hypothetical protein